MIFYCGPSRIDFIYNAYVTLDADISKISPRLDDMHTGGQLKLQRNSLNFVIDVMTVPPGYIFHPECINVSQATRLCSDVSFSYSQNLHVWLEANSIINKCTFSLFVGCQKTSSHQPQVFS